MVLPAYILAGGKSSRFGSDKARAALGGEPLVVRLARMLDPMARGVTVVADLPGKYDDLGLRTIGDLRPGLGPICGLEAALADAWHGLSARRSARPERPCHEWMLLVSCDLVVLRETWVTIMADHVRKDVDVVAFKAERWQPVPGLYRVSLLDLVRRQIDRGELAMWKLIERARHAAVPLPHDWPAVAQANTPADLERARAELERE